MEENGIADEDGEGDDGGREERDVDDEFATAMEGVDGGDEGIEDGRGECEDVSAVEGADMNVENRRDADGADCAALPDYSLPAISTTDSASVSLPLPVTATDTITSPVPLSGTVPVPVPVPVPALSLEEPPKNIDKQKAMTSTSDSVQDRMDAENDRTHAPDTDIPGDANNGSDDDSDDEADTGNWYEHPFATTGKDGKATAKICKRHFVPHAYRVQQQTKPVKKPKNGSASSDLASATTSFSTSDEGSLSASELQEQKQMTAQLSFMIARQR